MSDAMSQPTAVRCPGCGSTDVASFVPDDQPGTGYQCQTCQRVWYVDTGTPLEEEEEDE